MQVVFFAGVDEMDLIAPFEILASIATRADDDSTVTLVTPKRRECSSRRSGYPSR